MGAANGSCSQCGAELVPGGSFCAFCGAAVAGREAAAGDRSGAAASPPAGREGRKVVTALFADVVGSTALGERLDPEDYRQLIGDAVAGMVAAAERYGGEIRDLAGDGVLALFGSDIAHEDDPERAALAALEIVETISHYAERVADEWEIEGFSVRVGVETGLVVLGLVGGGGAIRFGAMGDTLNTAARLQASADPGTVLVGPVTLGLIETLFEWGDPVPLVLKGKAQPVNARRLLRRHPDSRGRGVDELAARLVGREEELASMRQALADVETGRGRVVFVTGEAGIGKSRLIAELRKSFNAVSPGDPAWFEGHSVSYAASEPYLPFRQALRQAVAERGAGTSPLLRSVVGLPIEGEEKARLDGLSQEALQSGVLEEVSSLLEPNRQGGPVCLVLDDLHWADPSTLRLASGLMDACGRMPLLLVLAMRPEEDHPAWELRARALGEHGDRASEITLRTLDPAAERMLVADRVGAGTLPVELEAELLARSEGNPFYLEELMRTLRDAGALVRTDDEWQFDRGVAVELPDTVERVILARLDRLGSRSRELLSAASVLGRQFELPVLRWIAGGELSADALAELESHGLIAEEAPAVEYRFKHPLIQETAYNGLLKQRRAELHARAAAAIEAMNEPIAEEHYPALARHHSAAGNLEASARYHELAGRAAQRVFALAEAVRHFDQALEAVAELGGDPVARRAPELHLARAGAYARMGDFAASVEDLRETLAGASASGDRMLEVRALSDLGHVVRGTGYEESIGYQERALRAAEELGDLETQVSALSRLSLVESNRLRLDRSLELGERALRIARDVGDERLVTTALDAVKLAAFQLGDLARLEEATSEIVAIQRRVDDPYFLQWALTESALAPRAHGDHDQALALIEEAGSENERVRDRLTAGMILEARSWIERSRGEYGAAIAAIREASAIAAKLKTAEWTAWIEATHGSHLLELRAAEAALPVLERARDTAEEAGTPNRLLRATSQIAWARCLLGAESEAGQALRRAQAVLAEVSAPPGAAFLNGYEAYLAIARAQLALGRTEQAEATLRPLLAAGEAAGWHEVVAYASALLGRGSLERGDGEDASAALEAAISAADRASSPGAAWEAHAALAELHRARGEAPAGERHAAKARSLVEHVAATVPDDELRQGFLRSSALLEVDAGDASSSPPIRPSGSGGSGFSSDEEMEALIRKGIEAFNRNDVETQMEIAAPEFEMRPIMSGQLEGETFIGHEGIRRYHERRAEFVEEAVIEPEEIRRVGEDRALVLGRWWIRGTGSDVKVESRGGWVYTFRGRKLVRAEGFGDPAEAERVATGSSESSADPSSSSAGADRASTAWQERLETLNRAYEALNAGDIEAALRYAADDFVIRRAGPDPPIRGKDAVRAFVAPDAFSEQTFHPLEFRGNGNFVFVWLEVRAKGATSGIAMEGEAAHVWEYRGGKVISLTVSFDRDEALELAGLSDRPG